MTLLFRLLSLLPLWLLHAMGVLLGWVAFLVSSVYRRRLLAHARQAGVPVSGRIGAVGEAGKMAMELPRLWMGRAVPLRWVGDCYVEQALARGGGLVFLTPHLGCFEVAAQAYAQRYGAAGRPMTVLYRPARKTWLRGVMEAVRHRPGLDAVPATLGGVKELLKALQRGDCVGLLPDQVPPRGQGQWLPFFGRDAYTMTLSARFAMQARATVLLAWGERLSWGRGYVVHVLPPLDLAGLNDRGAVILRINEAMERLIQQCPQQYLWGYDRYKEPRNVG